MEPSFESASSTTTAAAVAAHNAQKDGTTVTATVTNDTLSSVSLSTTFATLVNTVMHQLLLLGGR